MGSVLGDWGTWQGLQWGEEGGGAGEGRESKTGSSSIDLLHDWTRASR